MQDNNKLVLEVGQSSQATILPLLADGITPSGGTVSNVTFNFNDASATVTLNEDGISATVTAVAESTDGPVSGNATCTVTDTDGAISQWDQQFTIEVGGGEGPPPDQLTQSVAVQFSDPVDNGGAAGTTGSGTVFPTGNPKPSGVTTGSGTRGTPQAPGKFNAPSQSGKGRPLNE